MPRRWTKKRILAELVTRCDLPTPPEREPDAIVYTDAGLRRKLTVFPDRVPGLLRWHVEVAIAGLGRPGTTDFRTRYELPRELVARDGQVTQRYDSGYPWPTGTGPLAPRLVDDVRRFAAVMLWFLKDRQELGRLLLAGDGDALGGWEHNGVTAVRWTGGPAGVVQAVILARLLGDAELERLAYAKMDRHRDHVVMGFGGPFPHAVAHWATELTESAPVDISDLVALRRRHRKATR